MPADFETTRHAIATACNLSVDDVTPHARLSDLELDSLDLVSCAIALEDAHGIEVSDSALEDIDVATATVSDLHSLAEAALRRRAA